MTKYIFSVKAILLLFIALVLFAGCQKDNKNETTPDPIVVEPKAKISLTTGDKQSGTYGDYLPTDLSFKISVPQGKKIEQYYVQFAMIQGNGIIDNGGGYTMNLFPDGTLKVKWQLGCNAAMQKIKAYVYANNNLASGKAPIPEDSVEVQASGTKPTGWGKSCGCGVPDMFNAQVITHDQKTLYMAARELYSSTDGGMNWDKVSGVPKWSEVVGAQFNSKGWMYVLTKYDGVFLSKDLKSWQAINNGILDKRDPTGFMVKDDVLMVSFYFDGPYLTRDNGGFWQKLIVSGNSQRFMLFNQHSNGDLYLFDDWGTFFRSKDMGKTWQSLKLDYGYYLSQPSGFGIGPDGDLYIGSDDATIAKVSPATLKGTAKRYYEWNASSQSVTNIRFFNNDVFYLVRSTPKPGIYSVNNNWDRLNLNFQKTIVSYFIKPDGSFLLLSNDGLYYRN